VNEVRGAVVKDIVLEENKMLIIIKKSMTINGKTVLLICLRTAAGKSRNCHFITTWNMRNVVLVQKPFMMIF
jgi:hypothetical protein